jgi:tetrapyrrole methylase family protein/MazG family protein
VPGATSFDDVYESGGALDDVYALIVERLVEAARTASRGGGCAVSGDIAMGSAHSVVRDGALGEIVYAVPGSPLVAERTVELLRADARVETLIVPALSFLDLAWERLGVDPLAAGVRLVDGQRFAVEAAGYPGPMLVAQCDTRTVLSDIKLALEEGGGPDVTVLHHLGLPDESVRNVEWTALDREVEPDHLTTLWIPGLAAPVAGEMVRFAELVRTLRERCPWDRQQTHRSLSRHLVEETYEVLEAIDELPVDAGPAGAAAAGGEAAGGEAAGGEAAGGEAVEHLEEELGDLLFQVVFHATLAAEQGWFTLADVARGIHDKLVGRHPHVFGTVEATTTGEVMANWEKIKRAEKGRTRTMEGVPANLPALLYAHKLQRKAASVGFDWHDVGGPMDKVAEELAELRVQLGAGLPDTGPADAGPADAVGAASDELGDLLYAAVNVARHLGVDPESALRQASAKFRDRVDAAEDLASSRGLTLADIDPDGLDALWEEVKSRKL